MDLRKIAIIGCGMVGSSCAYALMESGLFNDMVLLDVNRDRAEGEAMDLSHCRPFIKPVEIRAGDYPDLANCGIIVVAAGVNQKPSETRIDCLKRNTEVFKSIVPSITKYNCDAFILVVSNPVDILSNIFQKLSGLPKSQVFGSGTVLDTARLKHIIGNRLRLDPRGVHAFVIGEHGDSELCVWSGASVSGISLDKYCETHAPNFNCDKENIEKEVVNSAYEIIKRKGATYYGISAAVRRICESIVRNEHSIMPLSVSANGHYGLKDVYIALPSVIGARGVEDVLDITLNDDEQKRLTASADKLKKAIESVGL